MDSDLNTCTCRTLSLSLSLSHTHTVWHFFQTHLYMYIHIYFCIHTRVFRNLSIKAQVIAWSMALALVFLLLVLSVFVFIILSGNTWISNGVNEGSQAVSTLLPELVRIRTQSLEDVERVVLTDFESLERQMYEDILQ